MEVEYKELLVTFIFKESCFSTKKLATGSKTSSEHKEPTPIKTAESKKASETSDIAIFTL